MQVQANTDRHIEGSVRLPARGKLAGSIASTRDRLREH
jgi:hypothetical protein